MSTAKFVNVYQQAAIRSVVDAVFNGARTSLVEAAQVKAVCPLTET